MKKSIVTALAIGILFISNADGEPTLNPQEIIKNSFKVMSRTSFRAEINKDGIKGIVYQRANPDGTVDVRTEYSMNESLSGQIDTNWMFVRLQNRDGMWELRTNAALRLDYLSKAKEATSARAPVDKLRENDYDYSLLEDRQNNVLYYLITATIHKSARSRILASLKNDETLNDSIPFSQLENNFPVETRYRIGESDLFMYSNEDVNKDGQKPDEMEYTNVVPNIPLSEDLFNIPKNLPIRILHTVEDEKKFNTVDGINAPHFNKTINPVNKKTTMAVVIFCIMIILPVLFFIKSRRNHNSELPIND